MVCIQILHKILELSADDAAQFGDLIRQAYDDLG